MTSNLFIHMAEESVIEFCDGDVLKDRYQILNPGFRFASESDTYP